MGGVDINQRNEAAIKKYVAHHAEADRNFAIDGDPAFTPLYGTVDKGASGLINLGRWVHPDNVLNVIGLGRPDQNRDHGYYLQDLILLYPHASS